MSWLPRSIANSLLIEEEEEDDYNHPTTSIDPNNHPPQSLKEQEFDPDQPPSNPQTLTGVQEDLSEFTQSLSRQIWGVASFLVPPPPPPPPPPSPPPPPQRSNVCSTTESFSCNGGDGDGIGVSNSVAIVGEDEEEKDVDCVGVTEEVLGFAVNIAHHPETWLDFPLSEDEDCDDFEMSDTQWNHATLVERLVPRLAALRIELCPIHMSESFFWKVYFVLLHPRLNKLDADLLSTPQIVAARAMWMKELQKQTKPGPESFEPHALDSHEECTTSSESPTAGNMLERTSHAFEPTTNHTVVENKPVLTKEDGSTNNASDQRVVSSFTIPIDAFADDEDDWIHENSELDGYDGPDVPIGAEEDISFSDLEDDDCMNIHQHLK